ncbi:MAG TPA: hemolysin family protein [Chthoniobacterales bacterium]|jgi:CBS domain containing-hemolysin-like protein|nr:hemolysin family protein [Chthoniobacterales bacterium]
MTIDIPFWFTALASSEVDVELGGSGSILFNLLIILLLVFLNGFFVASEFALVKVRSSQLDALETEDKKVELARRVTSHLDAYLSATQLGITLASLALGWIGEPYLAKMIRPVLMDFGMRSEPIVHGVSFALGFGVITYLHIVLGEVTPKWLGIRKALVISLWISAPLHLFYLIFRPAIWFLQASANWIMKSVFRMDPVTDTELAHSEEELRVILAENESPADGTELGNELLINALDFRRRVVRDIMTPRGDVIYLDLQDSFDANVQVAIESGHTRFPLVQGHLDNTVGLIHIKDLMREMKSERHDLLAIKRELMPVPEFMPLEKLLRQFLAKRAHFAVVVDEYGGAVGIVTLDNVVGELVGEIKDEFDQEQVKEFIRLNEEEFIVQGQVNLYELKELADLELENAEVTTIGGYVVQLLGHLPKPGEEVQIGDYLVTITQADGRRILQLHFKKHVPEPAEAQEHAANRDRSQ